jgi:hypothetical protein
VVGGEVIVEALGQSEGEGRRVWCVSREDWEWQLLLGRHGVD